MHLHQETPPYHQHTANRHTGKKFGTSTGELADLKKVKGL